MEPAPAARAEASRWAALVPYTLLALAAFFWATNWVLGRAMREEIPPVAAGFWRWVIALAILAPFAAVDLRRNWPVIRAHWIKLVVLGVMGASGYNTIIYVGLQSTPATNAVLFNSVSPILIIIFSWAAFGERLQPRQAIGVVISLLGIGAIISRGDPAIITALRPFPGDLWLMFAMVLWGLYTVLLRWRPPALSPTAFLTAMAAFGLPVLVPFYIWELHARGGFESSVYNLATLGFYGVFPSVLAYLFWHHGVARVGASRAGLFTHLVPAFGAILAVAFLGERLAPYHAVGVFLIFSGLYLTSKRTQNRAV